MFSMENNKEEFLRLKQVKSLIGLCRSSIYNKINEGTFPRPLRLGPQSVAWLQSEVHLWMSERIADRDQIECDHKK